MGCLPRSACLGSRCLTHHKDLLVLGESLEIWNYQVWYVPSKVMLDAMTIHFVFGRWLEKAQQRAIVGQKKPESKILLAVRLAQMFPRWSIVQADENLKSFNACHTRQIQLIPPILNKKGSSRYNDLLAEVSLLYINNFLKSNSLEVENPSEQSSLALASFFAKRYGPDEFNKGSLEVRATSVVFSYSTSKVHRLRRNWASKTKHPKANLETHLIEQQWLKNGVVFGSGPTDVDGAVLFCEQEGALGPSCHHRGNGFTTEEVGIGGSVPDPDGEAVFLCRAELSRAWFFLSKSMLVTISLSSRQHQMKQLGGRVRTYQLATTALARV
ncbi:hypothetical protein Tco_0628509 [Tanacetum coccineum]|uniref:Uncharacterized protein n=1 Tax=Tanacetum coccineum TaxID=301880 RepID=A0ABQ4WQJ7_9ASTR